MVITVLAENTAVNEKFKCEHGLSLYIETEKHKLLFDVGQTGLFADNAKLLNIDISEVDTVIISHAHYDHTGGLKTFFELNQKAKVYINENVDGDYFNATGKYIGIDKEVLKSDRLIFTKNELKLDEELLVFTGNNLNRPYPTQSKNLTMLKNNIKVEDAYEHEQYLVISENGKNILLSGCSHKGILNILDFAKPYDIGDVIGGFHLKELDGDRNITTILYEFSKLLISNDVNYLTCHCTGVTQFNILKKTMKNRLDYIATGQIMNI